MDTETHSRGKISIVLFILTLIGIIIIATGLILVSTSDEASYPKKLFVDNDINWFQNITENDYSLSYEKTEKYIRQSQEALQEYIQQPQENFKIN